MKSSDKLFIENYIKQVKDWNEDQLWSEYNKLCIEKKKFWRQKAFALACILREINFLREINLKKKENMKGED